MNVRVDSESDSESRSESESLSGIAMSRGITSTEAPWPVALAQGSGHTGIVVDTVRVHKRPEFLNFQEHKARAAVQSLS